MQRLPADIGFARQGSQATLGLSDKAESVEKHIDVIVLLKFFQSEFQSIAGVLGVTQVFQSHFIEWDGAAFLQCFHFSAFMSDPPDRFSSIAWPF